MFHTWLCMGDDYVDEKEIQHRGANFQETTKRIRYNNTMGYEIDKVTS